MSTQSSRRPARNLPAAGYMLLAAAIWGTIPLMIDLSDGPESPFSFNTAWRAGSSAALGIYLLIRHSGRFAPSLVRNPEVRPGIRRAVSLSRRHFSLNNGEFGGWAILYGTISKFELALLPLAARFVPISVAAISYESWPLILVLLLSLIFRRDQRYRKNGPFVFSMLALCSAGFCLIHLPAANTPLAPPYYLGAGIALTAAFLAGSHNAVFFRWSSQLAQNLHETGSAGKSLAELDLFSNLLIHAGTQFLCIFPSAVIGLLSNESIDWRMLAWSTGSGALTSGIGTIFFCRANLISDNLGVNAICYTAPLLALGWLFLAQQLTGKTGYFAAHNLEYSILGTAAIIVANLLISFETPLRVRGRELARRWLD